MNITIRNEEEKDFRRVEEIARDAFWNLYIPGALEHCLLHKMRTHKDFIKELAFVIEVDNVIQGAIFFTHSKVVQNSKEDFNTITFGPVYISPEYQRKGLGRQLITHAIDTSKKLGFSAMIILGFPYHYVPHGFVGSKKFNISMEDGNFYTGLQALELKENAFNDVAGYALFSDVYEVTEQEAEEFDKSFPLKEKQVLPCQKEYEIACSEIDKG